MIKKNITGSIYIYLFFFLIFSIATASPALISLSYVFISIFSIYYFRLELIKKIEVILFLLFFFTIIFSTSLSNIPFDEKISALGWIKIIFLLLFLFNFTDLFNNKIFSRCMRYFLYVIYFLIVDTFLQRFLNLEIFGNQIIQGRLTGPYGNELIIGGIILHLGLIPVILKVTEYLNKKKLLKSIFLCTTFFVSIFITGERMNTLISFMGIVLLIFFLHEYKKFILYFLIVYLLSISFISVNYEYREEKYFLKRFESFLFVLKTTEIYCGDISNGSVQTKSCKKYEGLPGMKKEDLVVKKREKITILDNPWAAHYLTAYEIWKDHKFFGAGNKSFRFLCGKYDNIKSKRKDIRCSTHPHNIYLEILSEFGIIGSILILNFIIIILFKSLKIFFIIFKDKSKSFLKNNKNEYWLFISAFIMFIILIWPIKSTGRLSSTFYGSMFWFYIFFLCALNYRIKKILSTLHKD